VHWTNRGGDTTKDVGKRKLHYPVKTTNQLRLGQVGGKGGSCPLKNTKPGKDGTPLVGLLKERWKELVWGKKKVGGGKKTQKDFI